LAAALAGCGGGAAPAASSPAASSAAPASAAAASSAPASRAAASRSPSASAAASTSASAAAKPAGGAPVKIGLSAAFSGPTAYLGESAKNAVQIGVDKFNAAGGVAGRPVQIVTEDNENKPQSAVTSVRKLIDSDGVVAVIGELGSSVTLAAMPVFKEKQVPNVAYVSTNPSIYGQMGAGGNPWVFRVNADDNSMAHAFSKQLIQAHKSYAIIAQNDDYGRGAVKAYDPLLKAGGVKITSEQFYDIGTPDFRPVLSKVKSENPEALLTIGLANDMAVMFHQYKELGLKLALYSRGAVATNEFLNRIKDIPNVADGLQEASVWTPGEDQTLETEYQKRYGQPVVVHGAMAYYAWEAMAQALKTVTDPTPKNIRDALAKVDYQQQGLGPIKFDDHNQAYPNMALSGIQGGKLKFSGTLPTAPASKS
ncbi:MAG: ABC transporter substrate-binding protein, partial [Chloroflexota bacterium]|nr:ABC transporter substrate-binding protein [Chloroflexota bacterium]